MAKVKSKGFKGRRTTVSIYFLTILIGFPFCFLALREVTASAMEAFLWDNAACQWVDKTLLSVPALTPADEDGGGFWQHVFSGSSTCKWLIDILTLPMTVWAVRFLSGAVEEGHYTYRVTILEMIEIFCRWMALSIVTALSIPFLTLIFFRTLMVLTLWQPIAFSLAAGMCIFLTLWGYQYPNRRLIQVTKVYQFKRLKYDEVSNP